MEDREQQRKNLFHAPLLQDTKSPEFAQPDKAQSIDDGITNEYHTINPDFIDDQPVRVETPSESAHSLYRT